MTAASKPTPVYAVEYKFWARAGEEEDDSSDEEEELSTPEFVNEARDADFTFHELIQADQVILLRRRQGGHAEAWPP